MPHVDQNFPNYYAWFCRFLGFSAGTVMFGIGIEAVAFHYLFGILIIFGAIVVIFFEVSYAINLLLKVMIKNKQSMKMRFWRRCLLVDGWKRGIIYMILTIPCFIQAQKYWLGAVAGGLTAVAGLCYCIKTLVGRQQTVVVATPRHGNYDRFDQSGELEYGPVEVDVMPGGSLVVDFPAEENRADSNNRTGDRQVGMEIEDEEGLAHVNVSDKLALDPSSKNSVKTKKERAGSEEKARKNENKGDVENAKKKREKMPIESKSADLVGKAHWKKVEEDKKELLMTEHHAEMDEV